MSRKPAIGIARTADHALNLLLQNMRERIEALSDDVDALLATTDTTSAASAEVEQLAGGYGIACSDETTPITAGTGKVSFRLPYMRLQELRISLVTAQASGNIFTVDVNMNGVSILSTKLTIDNTEKTSVTAAIPAVLTIDETEDDAEFTVDVDQVGDGTGAGLKLFFIERP